MKIKSLTKLFLVACVLSFSVIANAQVRFGPVAGLNMSNISGDGDSSNAMKMGFHIGGVVELGITDNFIIAPGVIYSIKGTQDKDESDSKLNLSYIEIPVLAKIKLESGLNFFAGPYLGLLMAATATDGTTDLDVKDFTESTDFGINLGLGFDMENGFGISAQYGMGLTSIYKDITFAGVTTSVDAKNSNIAITLRYMLGGD